MGTRGTLILALLVALAGAFLLYEESPPAGDRPSAEAGGGDPARIAPGEAITKLVEFDPSQVTEVILTRGAERVATTKVQGQWTATTPAGAVADFLSTLAGLAEIMRIEDGMAHLAEYGLAPPRATIELHRGVGAPVVVLLGDRNPAVTSAYAQIGRDGPVVLAGALILWEFNKTFRALGGTSAE